MVAQGRETRGHARQGARDQEHHAGQEGQHGEQLGRQGRHHLQALIERLAERSARGAAPFEDGEDRGAEQERQQIIEAAEQDQGADHAGQLGGRRLEHQQEERFEDAKGTRDMAQEADHDRGREHADEQGIADPEVGQQEIEGGGSGGQIQDREQQLECCGAGGRQRDPVAAELDAAEALVQAGQDIEEHAQQGRQADATGQGGRRMHAGRCDGRIDRQRQASQDQDAEREGGREEQLDARDIAEIEAVLRIDPVAQAGADHGGEAGRMRDRLGDERGEAGPPPGQRLADEAQGRHFVAGQGGEAERGAGNREGQVPGADRRQLLAQLGIGDVLQRPVDHPDREQQQGRAEDDRAVLAEPGKRRGEPVGAAAWLMDVRRRRHG